MPDSKSTLSLNGVAAVLTNDPRLSPIAQDTYDGNTAGTTYPTGSSIMRATGSAAGWPTATTYDVLTVKIGATQAQQFAYRAGVDTARHYWRRWNQGSSVWSTWIETTDVNNLQNGPGTGGLGYVDLPEQGAPANPATDTSRLYTIDVNGKTEPHHRDSSGDARTVFRDSYVVVQNTTAQAMPKGTVVRANGIVGTTPTVQLSDADAAATRPALGVLGESVLASGFGRCFQHGLMGPFDTSAMGTGQPIFVSATAGEFTQVPPAYPSRRQALGVCVSASATGYIFLNVSSEMRYQPLVPVVLFDGGTTLATSTIGQVGRFLVTSNMFGVLSEVRGILATASSSGSVTAVVTLNGTTTIGTLTFAAGSTTSNTLTPNQALSAGDYLTVHVTGAGTGAALLTVMGELMVT